MALRRREFLGAGPLLALVACAHERPIIERSMTLVPSERIARIFAGWEGINGHRTGSPDDNTTAQWLASEIRALGAEPVLKPFPFRRRIVNEASIVVAGKSAYGLPAFDGPGTPAGGVEGKLGALGLNAPIALCVVPPDLGPGQGAALTAAREGHLHDAIIAITDGTRVKPGLAPFNADNYRNPFGPPVLQLDSATDPWLSEAARSGAHARIVIDDSWEMTTATNVEVVLHGTDPDSAPLVIMTPRSGWWGCASERGGGIAVWLEMLRRLRTAPTRRTILFTANTGHELGHYGLQVFLEQNPQLAKNAFAWLHLGANFAAAQGMQVRLQTSSAKLQSLVSKTMTRFEVAPDIQTQPGAPPAGEARNIYDSGGQFVSLLGANHLFHHPDDRWPDAVDLSRTTRIASAFAELATTFAGISAIPLADSLGE